MTFLSTGFLLAGLAVAVPIIIHLIHRQRYPDRAFTTLRFFDKTVKHNVLQKRLIDRLLLALRILAILAIAIGLARPFWNLHIGEQRRSVVIVLDNSPSMSRVRDGQTLFDRARKAAHQILDTLGPTDQAALLLTSGDPAPRFTRDRLQLRQQLSRLHGQPAALLFDGASKSSPAQLQFSTDHQKLASQIDQLPADTSAALVGMTPAQSVRFDLSATGLVDALDHAKPSEQPGNVPGTLRKASDLLHDSRDHDQRVFLLTDLQESEWKNTKVDGLDHLPLTIGAIAPPGDEDSNLSIESIDVPREVTLGSTAIGTATICNTGTRGSSPASLQIMTGTIGRVSKVPLPAVAAGARVRLSFPINVMTRDRHLLCTATLVSATESYAYDNAWHFQLGVRPPVAVLVVNGVPASNGPDKESFFLTNALAPRLGNAQALADLRECDIADLKDQQLFQYAVVVLAGVPTLDAPAREAVRRFVNDGGGLMVFPGGKSVIDDYNAWGFLPARLQERKTADLCYVKSVVTDSQAVADAGQRIGTGISGLSASQWMRLDPESDARVLARLSNDAPALVEGAVGRGKVILSAAGCHAGESDWPLRPAFVILTRGLISYLGAPLPEVSIAPLRSIGQSAASVIPTELSAGAGSLFRLAISETQSTYLPQPWWRTSDRLAVTHATEPGQYVLSIQPGGGDASITEPGIGAITTPISVNHADSESGLAPLSTSQVTALLPGADVSVKQAQDDAGVLLADLNDGREPWRILLAMALLFLLIEGLLAWRARSETGASAAV